MSRPLTLCVAALFLSCLACLGPREAGPLEDEWGQVLFWEVTALESDATACTDAADFQDALDLPPLEPNTFFIVRVADDGRTAVAADCTETRAETCTDLDDFVFDIDGNVLEYVEPPEVVSSGLGCEVAVAPVWTMIDDGDIGALEVSITFPFDGDPDDCASLDADIATLGNNGDGLMDCAATLTADLEFFTAD